jgi:hypothetical protein
MTGVLSGCGATQVSQNGSDFVSAELEAVVSSEPSLPHATKTHASESADRNLKNFFGAMNEIPEGPIKLTGKNEN